MPGKATKGKKPNRAAAGGQHTMPNGMVMRDADMPMMGGGKMPKGMPPKKGKMPMKRK